MTTDPAKGGMTDTAELPDGWAREGDCVVCDCGFRFGAEHPDGDGNWSCPACEVLRANDAAVRATADRNELARKVREAEAENARLREALDFYATSWDGHPGDSGPGGIDPQDPDWWPSEALIEDGGKIARAALNSESEPKGERVDD